VGRPGRAYRLAGARVLGRVDLGFFAARLSRGLVGGMQGLDGCFLAARTAAAPRIGFGRRDFDASTSMTSTSACVPRAGLRLAVDTDILLAHASRGISASPGRARRGGS